MIGKEMAIEGERRDGFWETIKKALKFASQSSQGKYSLETYLEVLGEYTDQEIIEFIDTENNYGGGEVVFSTSKDDDSIKATVKMVFLEKSTGKIKIKKAERFLEKTMFIDESLDMIEKKGEVAYEILAPEGV